MTSYEWTMIGGRNLLHYKELRLKRETSHCGNQIWIIGSAMAGETYSEDDYEIL